MFETRMRSVGFRLPVAGLPARSNAQMFTVLYILALARAVVIRVAVIFFSAIFLSSCFLIPYDYLLVWSSRFGHQTRASYAFLALETTNCYL